MYNREKSFRHENHKPKESHRNMPSFSSSLLDEICRSIDGNGESRENHQAYRQKPVSGFRAKSCKRDEEISRFSRACLVEKWMEKEVVDEKVPARRRQSSLPEFENSVFQDNDLRFFSSTSSSSDSSGALSSSDTEFFATTTKSSFVKRPKPVRTSVENFDVYEDREKSRADDDLIKSKSRVLKMYANLKKLKQPISPGARLTSFINSIFTNMNPKKSKNGGKNKAFQEVNSPDQAASSATCSSVSSFSKSCLSKHQPKSGEKMRDGIQRNVRFHPVGVIVDQDSKPCGEKSIYNERYDKYGRPPLPPNALAESKLSRNRRVQEQRKSDFSMLRKIDDEEDDDEDEDENDAFSESSSDLFELDNLSLFGNKDRFCEELPVYETTYFDKNRGLIR